MNASGCLRVFVPGAIAVGFSVTAVAAPPAALTISYRAPASLTLHEPVLVDFAVENASAEPVQFDLGDNRRALFVVKVEGPRGVLPDAVVHDTGLMRRGLVTVKANERYTQQLLLNDWFAFQDPGQYDIQIQLHTRIVGTPEARAALDKASRSTDSEQAALARDALRRMPAR